MAKQLTYLIAGLGVLAATGYYSSFPSSHTPGAQIYNAPITYKSDLTSKSKVDWEKTADILGILLGTGLITLSGRSSKSNETLESVLKLPGQLSKHK